MLIVSNFHDYYDTSMGIHGIDKTIVYNRKTEEIKKFHIDLEKKLPHISKGYSIRFNSTVTKDKPNMIPYIIGFCGKSYVVYKKSWYEEYPTENFEFIYDYEEIKKILLNNKERYDLNKHTELQLAEAYKFYHNKPLFKNVFLELKTPIFSYELHKQFIINPKLLDYQFFKVFDPFTTFQEIQMFIGGVLTNPEKNYIQIDEKYRQAQRGLDKTSFRQQAPGKKKEQRKINKERKRKTNENK